MKRSQIPSVIYYVFMPVGLLLIAGACFFYFYANKFVSEGLSTEGFFEMCIMGMIFFGIGYGVLSYTKKRKEDIEWLKMYGRKIETDFVKVEMNRYISINKRHPYIIFTEYKGSGATHIFRSENIWHDPTSYVTQKKIKVLVDPNNMLKYYMDVSFVPEEEPEKAF